MSAVAPRAVRGRRWVVVARIPADPESAPRDVFRYALNDHAAAVIVFHSHPSGDPSPSPQDLAFTTKLVSIGQPLGVKVLDHLIVTSSAFVSFKQRDLM